MSRFRWLRERLPREMVSLLGLLRNLEIWQVAGNSVSFMFLSFSILVEFFWSRTYILLRSRFFTHADKERLGMRCACSIFDSHHFDNDIVKTRQPCHYVHSWWHDATSGEKSKTAQTSVSYGYDSQTSTFWGLEEVYSTYVPSQTFSKVARHHLLICIDSKRKQHGYYK